jgi:Fe-S-cluster containining protein
MSDSPPNPPWYAAGLAFECQRCGQCCAGPLEGYVWLCENDVSNIAAALRVPVAQVYARYVRTVGSRLSLREDPGTHDCLFLLASRQDGARKCAVYTHRPAQCRNWPFWPANLESPADWAISASRCAGINRGPLHALEEIESRRNDTRE